MFLDRQIPAVREHGYLLATVVTKPASLGVTAIDAADASIGGMTASR
jgi:hypothetical protein